MTERRKILSFVCGGGGGGGDGSGGGSSARGVQGACPPVR